MSEGPSRQLLLVAGLASMLVATSGLASAQPDPVSGVHVAHGEDPARETIVAWLAPPDVDAHVAYGIEDPEQTAAGEAEPAAGSERVPYRAPLTGLEPATTYVYRVVAAGEATEERTFTTAPPAGGNGTVRITAFADHGTAMEANRGDGDAPTSNTELAASLDPDVHLLAGDLSYAEGRAEHWNTYAEQIQPLAAEVPFMTVPGNHERESVSPVNPTRETPIRQSEDAQGFHQYDARFPMPTPEADDERWWAIQRANVLLVGLNTERGCAASFEDHGTPEDPAGNCEYHTEAPHEPQLTFLEETLAAADEEPTIDWTILLVHHPFWSTGGHGSAAGLQEHYMPVLDEHGVDLVVQGHDHVYERTELLREGDVAPEGTLYVTNGVGGSGFYGWQDERSPNWSAARANDAYGTLVIDLAEDRLEGRFVTLAGDTLDSFTFANVEDGGLAVPAAGGEEGDASSETSADDPRLVSAPASGTLVLAVGIAALAAGGVGGLTPGRGGDR